MKKRIFSYMIALVMVCSIICVGVPAEAAAASKPYMSVSADFNGRPWDKVGNYYIWVDNDASKGRSALVRASSPKGKQKILKKFQSEECPIDNTIVTNGNTIYYSVTGLKKDTCIIYKTDITGKNHKKIASVRAPWGAVLSSYYKGKLCFSIIEDRGETSKFCEYDISKKKIRMIKFDPYGYSGYNEYVLCTDRSGYKAWLYNMKTKKFKTMKELAPATNMVVYGTTIYYSIDNWNTGVTTIKRCNLSGKNIKSIKKLKNATLVHLGKKAVYYTIGDSEKVQKLAY